MKPRTTLFFLHGLGCSAGLWRFVTPHLAGFDCVALDLPGHAAASDSSEITVEQMVHAVTRRVRGHRNWGIVGHSMGAKIATVVAARAERCVDGLTPPIGLALVSGSPLSPEPMSEADRARMIEWWRDGAISDADAQSFVDANTSARLPDDVRAAAVSDVRAVSRTAWLAWLERGSLEDWRGAGPIFTPTLVVAGADDDDLGVDAQRSVTLPHVNAASVASIAGAKHLGPLEEPSALALLLERHYGRAQASLDELPRHYADLLNSGRVSARTRGLLVDRLTSPEPSDVFDEAQRTTLRALLARVVPQRTTAIDLAARLEASLAAATTDGWRFADLPSDAEAWRRGLDTLHGFAVATTDEQDAWIARLIDGTAEAGQLDAAQLTLWFEDVRAEAVRTWLCHPAAQAAVGYDGFANGGDGARKQGYLRTGAGEREPWQAELPVVSR